MSKPVPHVPRLVIRVDIHQLMELRHQMPNRSLAATGELSRIDKDETVMRLSSLVGGIRKRDEIHNVLGDDCSTLQLSCCKNCGVGQRAKLHSLRHGAHVMPTAAKLLRDRSRVHLVYQEPQPSASRARSQMARWCSASWRLIRMRSSISSLNSP